MSNRAKIWTKKRDSILKKEDELKKELGAVSDLLEERTKTILIISLVTGGLFLFFYLIYRTFFKTKARDTPPSKKKKSKKAAPRNAIISTLITERLINAALKYGENYLNSIIPAPEKKKKR